MDDFDLENDINDGENSNQEMGKSKLKFYKFISIKFSRVSYFPRRDFLRRDFLRHDFQNFLCLQWYNFTGVCIKGND